MSDVIAPDLSVVIPTRNRRETLLRTLDALGAQKGLDGRLEVIVVDDGGNDGTGAALGQRSWPFALHLMRAEGKGAASARNLGASAARGERLVFLDDDIAPEPGFLAAHLVAGRAYPTATIVGQSLPVVRAGGAFGRALAGWWIERFREMAEDGHRFGFTDVMSGNLSVPRATFAALSGFNAVLRCREDYEFGLRLVAAGIPIRYVSDARGLHRDASTPARNLVRARDEGFADFQIAGLHPDVFPSLKAASMTLPTTGAAILRMLVFHAPFAGRLALSVFSITAGVAQRLGLDRIWGRLNARGRALAYHQGVAHAAGSLKQYRQAHAAVPTVAVRPLTLDLTEGVDVARAAVASALPDALTLSVGFRTVGQWPAQPGHEPLGTQQFDVVIAKIANEWAVPVELARSLPPSPPAAPDWAENQADPSRGYRLDLAALDIANWSLAERSQQMAFPIQILVRDGALPIGQLVIEDAPGADEFWPALRRMVLADAKMCMRALRSRRIPADLPPAPPISVVVCTRDRPKELARCLAALSQLDYPDHEIIVVDNASTSVETRTVVQSMAGIRYVREDRPGLDWARNRGIAEARHAIVAYTDDDTEVDRHWLQGYAAAFARPDVDFATGLVLPMKLDTDARLYFEGIYGGMGKGFDPFQRKPGESTSYELLWASNMGVGANMAFRRDLFDRVGNFDPALDVGTATRGGGDIEMFHRAVARGGRHAYVPPAFVWHEHRAELSGLARQLADNGSGFGAYLLACWRNRTVPRHHIVLFALRHWIIGWLLVRLVRPGRHSRKLVIAEIRGMLAAHGRWCAAQATAREIDGRGAISAPGDAVAVTPSAADRK